MQQRKPQDVPVATSENSKEDSKVSAKLLSSASGLLPGAINETSKSNGDFAALWLVTTLETKLVLWL